MMGASILIVTTASTETLNGTILGVALFRHPHLAEQGGEETKVTPKMLPFSKIVHYIISLHEQSRTPQICLAGLFHRLRLPLLDNVAPDSGIDQTIRRSRAKAAISRRHPR